MSKDIFDIFQLDYTVIVNYKYGNIYRDVMRLRKVDVCGIAKLALGNNLVKAFIEAIDESTPGALHECPYTVR